MSRLEEVEADLAVLSAAGVPDLARTLAAEVDELRGKLAEYESECYALRAVTAEKNSDVLRKRIKARDEVITNLLEMLEPGRGVFGTPVDDNTVSLSVADWQLMERLHARACEIAGRTE